MTAVDTTGYNIAWFSPKPLFSNVSQVCWDINETLMSRRKWTQVLFVECGRRGAVSGRGTDRQTVASPRGHRRIRPRLHEPRLPSTDRPNDGVFPQGTLAGFKRPGRIGELVPEPGQLDD